METIESTVAPSEPSRVRAIKRPLVPTRDHQHSQGCVLQLASARLSWPVMT